jgi:hypothetical protein
VESITPKRGISGAVSTLEPLGFSPEQIEHFRNDAAALAMIAGARLPVIGSTVAKAPSYAGETKWRRFSKLPHGDLDWRIFSTRDTITTQREDLARHGGLM